MIPTGAQTNVCPLPQRAATTSTQEGDRNTTGSPSELFPVVQPFAEVRTKLGRCVHPPVCYMPGE